MKLYKNGDRCPCCGQRIEGKSDDWLELFSQTVDMLRLPPWEAQALSDIRPTKRLQPKCRGFMSAAAKADTKRKRGRPVKQLDPDLFNEVVRAFYANNITADQAAAALGIARSTFFLRLAQISRAAEGVKRAGDREGRPYGEAEP